MINSKRARWMTALAAAAILAVGGAQFAVSAQQRKPPEEPGFFGPGMRGPGPGGDFMEWRILRQLGLTEEQQAEIRQMRKTHFEQTETEREALMEARRAFHDAVQTGDETAIREAASTMATAEADLAIARLGFRKELLQILTPEQQQKLKELRAEMEAFRQERMQRRKEHREKLLEEGSPKSGRVY